MKTKALLFLSLFALVGCDITGLERSRSSDNRTTYVEINESMGQSLYLDNDGWSWLIDRYGNVVDGPYDIGNNFPPGTPLPEAPNPPPPLLVNEAGASWVLALLLLMTTSCAMNFARDGHAALIGHAEVQPGIALSIGSRTQASSAASQDKAEIATESYTEGGGTVQVPSSSLDSRSPRPARVIGPPPTNEAQEE